ncbi:hypothetical protein F2P56_015859, partial [Juglans regia]
IVFQEVAESVKKDFGSIDILVHSLANGPEVSKPLLETSRKGYLAAISASSYSYVSLLKHFVPIMNPGGSSISLTYIASERIIPGYGGGMSSAKAALESDTKVLAFEAGRKHKIRVNTISAGTLVHNLPANILPISYTGQNHGQSSYTTDDLPKTVVMTLNQGSAVKSMDFHPLQQILLLGEPFLMYRMCNVSLLLVAIPVIG